MANLRVEQEHALHMLVQQVHTRPVPGPAGLPPTFPTANPEGWLEALLGVSQGDLEVGLRRLVGSKEALQERLLTWSEERPMDAVFEFLAGASLAFYAAEREVNPKIHTYMDAFYYISTCASVGYADVFAITQTGRMIASLVMIVGPALTNNSLGRPKKNR